MKQIILIITFLIATPLFVFAQNTKEAKIRLAESYEKQGDFENASRLFLELYSSNPSDAQAFDAYVRNMKSLNKYTYLLDFVIEHSKKNKNSKVFAILGELYWRAGKTKEADSHWQMSIDFDRKNLDSYIYSISSQLELKLLDKAVNTILLARKELGDDKLFAEDLGKIYSSLGEVEKSLNEIIKIFLINNNLPSAQGKIQALLSDTSAESKAKIFLESAYSRSNENFHFMRLMAWFYKEIRDKNKALELVEKIDKVSNTQGREILQFADQSRYDGDFETALKAYYIVVGFGKTNPNAISAVYGIARTLEQKLIQSETIETSVINNIILKYQDVIKDYPNNYIAYEAQFRCGILEIKYLKNREKGESLLEELIKKTPNSPVAINSLLELGLSVFETDRLPLAKSFFNRVLQIPQAQINDKDKAQFNLALIEYYTGNIDTLNNAFKDLAQKPNSLFANEALEKFDLISSCKNDLKELKIFANAEYLMFQNKDVQALELFQKSADLGVNELSDRALLKIAEIYFKLKDCSNIKKIADSILNESDAFIYGDKILLLAGRCFINKDNSIAENILKNLLVKYPRSIYLQSARDIIRQVRTVDADKK